MERCRICFAPDETLDVLHDTQVMEFLESLFVREGVNEQLYGCFLVCYKCKALLSKSYNFIQKVLKAQRAFLILQDQKTANTDLWTSFVNELGLNSLSYHKVEINMFIKSEENLLHEEEIDNKELLGGLIKLKYPIEVNILGNDDDESHCSININVGEYEHKLRKNREANKEAENYYQENSSIGIEEDEPKPLKKKKSQKKTIKTEEVHITSEGGDKPKRGNKRKMKNKYKNDGTKKDSKAVKKRKFRNKTKNDNADDCSNYGQEDLTSVKEEKNIELKTEKQEVNFTELNRENILKAKRRSIKEKKYLLSEDEELKNYEKDKDFTLNDESSSSESESSYDSYDDNGRKLKKPPREYPRQCDHCNYEIESAKVHYHHYLIFHSHDKYPYRRMIHPFICQYCGIRRRSPNELAQHEATHGERKVLCTKCDKKFHNKKQLQQHYSSVHCEAKFICDYCTKGFKTKEEFMRHIRIHTGEKPFKCYVCEAGFAHLGNLKLHLRKGHTRLDEDGNLIPWKGRPRTKKNSKAQATDDDDDDDISLKILSRKKKRCKKAKVHTTYDEDKPTPRRRGRPRKKSSRNTEVQAMEGENCVKGLENANVQANNCGEFSASEK